MVYYTLRIGLIQGGGIGGQDEIRGSCADHRRCLGRVGHFVRHMACPGKIEDIWRRRYVRSLQWNRHTAVAVGISWVEMSVVAGAGLALCFVLAAGVAVLVSQTRGRAESTES